MCACRQQRKSFLIEDILSDTRRRYQHLSHEPSAPLACSSVPPSPPHSEEDAAPVQRRHTYPLCPQPLLPAPAPPPRALLLTPDAALPLPACCQPPPPLYSPYAAAALRHAYSLDAGTLWWRSALGGGGSGAGGAMARRAGGQVRFTAAQSSALERRFAAVRYLSPDQRRRLARDLTLSDRQVKTWFQNRRAKWRRSSPSVDTPRSPRPRDVTTPPPLAPHPATPPSLCSLESSRHPQSPRWLTNT